VTSRPHFFSASNAIVRLLAAGPGLPTTAETQVVQARRTVQPNAGVTFIAADREDAGGTDDVAGSEFVDDRIRLRD
jgi:hypothetical protein